MIRRDEQGAAHWVLISQIEHARLAGDLARSWRDREGLPLSQQEELSAAISRHDDGWAQWEQAPEVDAATGVPLSFTEMPLSSALEIWQASIERIEPVGPLAAWIVAGHFSAMLQLSSQADSAAATRWHDRLAARRAAWLAAWQSAHPDHTRARAERSLRYLQLFDRLSLWLCTACRREPSSFATPDGQHVTVSPGASNTFQLAPWPLLETVLDVQLRGEAVPVARYEDRNALALAPRKAVSFHWRFLAGE